MRRLRAALAVGLWCAPLLAAQENKWVDPQPPCDIKASSHFQVTSGQLDLKIAVENPAQRDRMLKQAQDVLTRAIMQNHQDKNAAAWYFFGRYYVEIGDAAGADSTFSRAETLAPQCAQDTRIYRQRVWTLAYNAGLGAWQAGKTDSAAQLLRVAARVAPWDPRADFRLSELLAGAGQLDSAAAVARHGVTLAGTDTAYTSAARDALATIARVTQSHAEGDPAVQQWQRTRELRDSLNRAIAADSGVLARMLASAAARKARRARLSPTDQQQFARDSSARAQAVASGQAIRASSAAHVASDSAAAQAAFTPAIAAARDFLAADRANDGAVTGLAVLYAESGRQSEAAAVFDSVFGADLPAGTLIDGGRRMLGAGLPLAGTRVLSKGVAKNPNLREALYDLANGYYVLRDSTAMLPVAQRLVAVDPLNRASTRLLAAAWDLRGKRDSVLKYVARADTGLALEITAGTFVPDSAGTASLTVIAANLRTQPSKPVSLVVEFLDGKGAVTGSATLAVPAIAPGSSQQLEAHAAAKGSIAWRYRAS